MLLIPCPWCGRRDEREFAHGGDASTPRLDAAAAPDPARDADRLYGRPNPEGWHDEYWLHRHGCGRWFVLRRHTLTHAIAGSAPPGAALPDPSDGDGA